MTRDTNGGMLPAAVGERNPEAVHRVRMARYFMKCLREMGLGPREVARMLKMDYRYLRKIHRVTPQLRVLEPLGALVERLTRERLRAGLGQNHRSTLDKKPGRPSRTQSP